MASFEVVKQLFCDGSVHVARAASQARSKGTEDAKNTRAIVVFFKSQSVKFTFTSPKSLVPSLLPGRVL